ncbi:MAG: cyclic nucleotide-binding domain-containing protein [Chromatiaceae bacterium]|nr:cyclic nucleotide-binding domain-containing protein [Chromatiaceae bacterium]
MITNKILRLMKQRFNDFRGISAEAMVSGLQVFRLFEIREGESLRIGGSMGEDHLLVALGRVHIDGDPWDPIRSADAPFVLPSAPVLTTVEAIDDSVLCHLDLDLLDMLLAEEQLVELGADTLAQERMALVRSTDLLRKIPLENLDRALELLRETQVEAGAEPVKMGKESDCFFVLVEGAAELWRIDDEEGIPMKAEDLGPGSCFGEEGLLMKSPSPVTVRFTTDGRLLTLPRDDFQRLLARPMVREVDVHVAKTMRERGYPMLDVRLEEEHEEIRIPGTQLIPLSQLRKRAGELDQEQEYVVYCRSGRRSSVASFLLGEMGFRVVNMTGGIKEWPFEVEGDEVET